MKLFISSCNFKEDDNVDSSNLAYRIPCVQFEKNGWKTASITELPNLTIGNIERLCGFKPTHILVWMCSSYVLRNKAFFWRIRKYRMNIKTYWYIDDIHNNTKTRAHLFNYFDLILNSYATLLGPKPLFFLLIVYISANLKSFIKLFSSNFNKAEFITSSDLNLLDSLLNTSFFECSLLEIMSRPLLYISL